MCTFKSEKVSWGTYQVLLDPVLHGQAQRLHPNESAGHVVGGPIGGLPKRPAPPFLTSSIKAGKPNVHLPATTAARAATNTVRAYALSGEACAGAPGRTFTSLTTSCLDWVECHEVANKKDEKPITAKDNRVETQKQSGSSWGLSSDGTTQHRLCPDSQRELLRGLCLLQVRHEGFLLLALNPFLTG